MVSGYTSVFVISVTSVCQRLVEVQFELTVCMARLETDSLKGDVVGYVARYCYFERLD